VLTLYENDRTTQHPELRRRVRSHLITFYFAAARFDGAQHARVVHIICELLRSEGWLDKLWVGN